MKRIITIIVALVAMASGMKVMAAEKEAYAVYTPDDKTLTFYYDDQRYEREGYKYSLNTGTNIPGWINADKQFTKVVFAQSFANYRPTTTYKWFIDQSHLTTITNIQNLKTENVTVMEFMFSGCKNLTSLDLSSFDTSKVTGMMDMFSGCSSLTSLDLSNFDTSKVTDMMSMFSGCSSLTSLDLSNFDTSNVTTMYFMFYNCSKLTSLDVSSFDTSDVTDMSYMFHRCSSLTTVYVGSKWTIAKIVSSEKMFNGCAAIKGEKGTIYDATHTDAWYAHIDGGTDNPGYFTRGTHAYAVDDNGVLTFYYDKQRYVHMGTTYDMNTGKNNPGWYDVRTQVTKVVFDPSFTDARPTSTNCWFYEMGNLTSITGLQYLNTSEVTTFRYMFVRCSKLTSLDLSGFNTRKVTSLASMFSGCSSLTSIDLSRFNTSGVTYTGNMFSGCSSLKTIYVGSGWTMTAVTTDTDMFKDCTALVGGQGTRFSSSHIGKEYAHIDGGSSNPGYFTGVLEVVTGISEASPLNDNGEAVLLNDKGQMINDQAGEWYSLDGRRVMAPQKGHIYIREGRKVVY